ncbi:MAG: LapA family protein [Tolypothrix carrinoi HA7290-LM1]|nr:LapA family protein [Tolypothrix carrinoi HA7290-LM1]
MDIIRLILLVAVLGGLTLLLAQNWSPVLPLVFLGIRTQPLPLAMWILFSTTAGAVTSVFISSLFNLSAYLARQQRPRLKSPAASPQNKQTRREETFSRPPVNPTPTASTTESRSSNDVADDWDTNKSTDDDWDFEEKSNVASTQREENIQDRDQSYERQQQPKTSSQSGSVYSYSYRQPKNSGVGKTESVYDADYRVIIPPYQPPTTTNQKNDDDDWGFFDDDDVDDDERSRS